MSKITLLDNDISIKSISILCLFRNSSTYLDYFFKIMERFEDIYDIKFQYYFCENNSTDDTRAKLKQFSKNRDCKLLLLELEKDYIQNELSINFDRINTLLTLRNKLKDTFAPFNTDYTLFIDSGIHFKENILQDMFKYNPTKNNIAMMIPYVVQIYPKKLIINKPEFANFKKQIESSDAELINLNHYFDTYATIDNNSIFMYPLCPFKKCNLCAPMRKQFNYELIPEDQHIAEVKSSFAGFAIIKTEIFNNINVRWDSICLNTNKHTSICEHILFCDRVKTVSGKKVVVLQAVQDIFRTN
jgi:hypothetical protein